MLPGDAFVELYCIFWKKLPQLPTETTSIHTRIETLPKKLYKYEYFILMICRVETAHFQIWNQLHLWEAIEKNTLILSNLSVIHTNKTIFSLRKTVFKHETSPFYTRQQQWLTKTTIQNLVSFWFLADPGEYVSPGSCEAFI